MQLASRFSHRSPVLRSHHPLSDDQIRAVAPSIFADTPHESRSERYSYIRTATVLTELRKEGFQPFMVCQTRVRHEDRRDYTKHMLRLRHASQINGDEANEIILINSHDGTSSYQRYLIPLPGDHIHVCSTQGHRPAAPAFRGGGQPMPRRHGQGPWRAPPRRARRTPTRWTPEARCRHSGLQSACRCV